jgi:hypothetical protein
MEVSDSKRMPASRAVQLIANAMAAGVPECWLARQPVLLMGEFGCRAKPQDFSPLQGVCGVEADADTLTAVCSMLCTCVCKSPAAAYLMQYVPQVGLAVMKYIGPKRARALSSGQSGYNLAAMMKQQGGASSS